MKAFRLALAVALLALPLLSCGRKGPPQPPPGETVTYPGHYPADATTPGPVPPGQNQNQVNPILGPGQGQ